MDDLILQTAIVTLVFTNIAVFYLNRINLREFKERIKADEEMLFRLAESITQNGKDILQLHGEFNERLKLLEERKKPGRKKKETAG